MLYIYSAIAMLHLVSFWFLWARTKKRVIEKLFWSLVLFIPVIGLIMFFGFQDPPSSHSSGLENPGLNSND